MLNGVIVAVAVAVMAATVFSNVCLGHCNQFRPQLWQHNKKTNVRMKSFPRGLGMRVSGGSTHVFFGKKCGKHNVLRSSVSPYRVKDPLPLIQMKHSLELYPELKSVSMKYLHKLIVIIILPR